MATTKNNSVKIYTNDSKVSNDISNVYEVKQYIDLLSNVLTAESIDPKHAISVAHGRYFDIKQAYIENENQKLEQAAALIGGSALIEVARDKVQADAEKLISKLQAKVQPLNWQKYEYLNYFVYEAGAWTIRKGFEQEISDKNSIILTDPTEIERYQKHVQLVDLLNELKDDGMNVDIIVRKLCRFNAMEKTFSLNYRNFDKNNVVPIGY